MLCAIARVATCHRLARPVKNLVYRSAFTFDHSISSRCGGQPVILLSRLNYCKLVGQQLARLLREFWSNAAMYTVYAFVHSVMDSICFRFGRINSNKANFAWVSII